MAAKDTPMPVDPEMLRAVMRHWPTGVTIMTTRDAGQVHGMTVNSFTSVSLEPALVLVCIENNVRTHAMVLRSGVFAISILRVGGEPISDRFAGRDTENTNRFEGLETITALTGSPILAENIGYLDCVVNARHPAGNHTIFVAEVVAAHPGPLDPAAPPERDDAAPLLYFNRDYHRLC
jgi:flavin reductase (DIM6/NTAB) family NADH-FMN oxidoreductase RutF